MKHLFYTWKLGCLLLLILAGCSSKKSVSSYHSFESECLGVELDGSETLRAWGRGKNRTDAIEQAKKNGHSCISPWQYNHVIQRLWTL